MQNYCASFCGWGASATWEMLRVHLPFGPCCRAQRLSSWCRANHAGVLWNWYSFYIKLEEQKHSGVAEVYAKCMSTPQWSAMYFIISYCSVLWWDGAALHKWNVLQVNQKTTNSGRRWLKQPRFQTCPTMIRWRSYGHINWSSLSKNGASDDLGSPKTIAFPLNMTSSESFLGTLDELPMQKSTWRATLRSTWWLHLSGFVLRP